MSKTITVASSNTKQYKIHVRHYFKAKGNGFVYAGTVALFYDRINDIASIGISKVHSLDIGRAKKSRGYQTATSRAFKAYGRAIRGLGARSEDTIFGFSVFMKRELAFAGDVESTHLKKVFKDWADKTKTDHYKREKNTTSSTSVTELIRDIPNELKENFLNSKNLKKLTALMIDSMLFREKECPPIYLDRTLGNGDVAIPVPSQEFKESTNGLDKSFDKWVSSTDIKWNRL